ncbi:MAG: epoxyqueuosine reductase QueH [Candidatus Omnitrophota bacterium]|nr:epoxyqueuosine reductase QueH [Candidatus Omnitrophota bacterium]
MKKVLLHICCGICALYCIERLKKNGFYVEGFFFNPNIHPESEYVKRKQMIAALRQISSIKILEGKYEPDEWHKICGAYQEEKEGGKRCLLCYQMRLVETFNVAKNLNFDYFSTTLTISPHKSSKAIIELGKKIGADTFLDNDFKKSNGFTQTMELAKRYNFYHQNYCGCIYSLPEATQRLKNRD